MQKFPVGTLFLMPGKFRRECKIVDFLTTTNLAGQVVEVRYVAEHVSLGQVFTNRDICETTVARGICAYQGVYSIAEAVI